MDLILVSEFWILDSRFWILGFGFWILDSKFWILDPGFWILNFGSWILDFGFWILNSRFWILDSGFWILDSGSWILDSRSWVLDSGSWNIGTWQIVKSCSLSDQTQRLVSNDNEIHIHIRSYSSNETFLISKMNSSRSLIDLIPPAPHQSLVSIPRQSRGIKLKFDFSAREGTATFLPNFQRTKSPIAGDQWILNVQRSIDRSRKKNGDIFPRRISHLYRHLNLLRPTKEFLLISVKADSSISKQGFNFHSILFSAQPI